MGWLALLLFLHGPMTHTDDQRALLAGPGTPQPGTLLAGKYRIQRIIGVGGMGVVLAAEHEELGERVAIKCLLPHLAHDAVFVARFQREARAAVKIRSEHIARVLDVSRTDAGLPFIVMEYLEGQDLGALLEKVQRLDASVAVGYVLQACEALAEAHALGIVHRDLKPENLFLTNHADGTEYVKVMDFGISKMANAGPDSLSLTRTGGGVMGSPLYMAPEQMRSAKDADPRTDIWALGAILHEFIVGEPPFIAASIQEIVAMIVQDPTPSLVERAAAKGVAISPGLGAAVDRALEKHASARYADVAAFAFAVAPYGDEAARASAARIARVLERRARAIASGSSPSISRVVPVPSSSPARPSARRDGVGTQSAATWTEVRPPGHKRSRTVLVAALGLLGAALVGTVAAVTLNRSGTGAPSASLPSAPSAVAPPVTSPLPALAPSANTSPAGVGVAEVTPAASTTSKKAAPATKPDKLDKARKPTPADAPPTAAPPAASAIKPSSGLANGRHD